MNGNERRRPEAEQRQKTAFSRVPPVFRRLIVIRRRAALRLRMERLWQSFADSVQRDLDAGHGGPWVVLCFAFGIGVYFSLPREPVIWATVPLALALCALAWRRRSAGHDARGAILLAAISAGLACADLRTALVEAPRLARAGGYDVTGRVVAVERRQTGYRVTVRPISISRVAPDNLPRVIRVTARSPKTPPEVGSGVGFRARLAPPGGAVLPGGYAFDLAAYYARIGASGFIYGAIRPVALPPPDGLLRMRAAIVDVRLAISERIRQSIGGDAGGIAAALIVGDRGGVGEAAQENLRVAGLAHVLAISGMHMALVSGTIFFALRAVLAAFSNLALGYPIRGWAAAAALIAATAYLLLSGASIATQRAYIMAAIVFIAILSARPALTMRSVAVAALVIMAGAPEALLQPGFQMSFAAVIALVAAYEAWSKRERHIDPERPTGSPVFRKLRFWIIGLMMTSLIAGLATAPIAAAHFYRAAPLGLIANIAAMPLVSLVIMPAAVVSVLAMPFGLDPLPLAAMGSGIDAMLAVAARVADWTPSGGLTGRFPNAAALASVCALVMLAFLKSRWRLIGLAPLAVAMVAASQTGRPDILISEDGRSVAARQVDGRLAVLQGRGGRFSAEVWLRADGDAGTLAARKGRAPALRCDDLGCVLNASAPTTQGAGAYARLRVAVLKSPQALTEDCRKADIIVAPFNVPDWCARSATVFDRARLARDGATALYLDRDTGSVRLQGGRSDHETGRTSGKSGSSEPGPQTMPLRPRIALTVSARAGRHRPWHGVPAD